MSETSEVEGRSICITIKSGKEFDKTWQVFRGLAHELRDDLNNYFGLDAGETSAMTLHELQVYCTQIAHGTATVAVKLGGKPATTTERAEPEKPSEDVWAATGSTPAAESAPAANPNAHLFEKVAALTTVSAAKKLYAENKAAMESDAELRKAWGAKGKELSK